MPQYYTKQGKQIYNPEAYAIKQVPPCINIIKVLIIYYK